MTAVSVASRIAQMTLSRSVLEREVLAHLSCD